VTEIDDLSRIFEGPVEGFAPGLGAEGAGEHLERFKCLCEIPDAIVQRLVELLPVRDAFTGRNVLFCELFYRRICCCRVRFGIHRPTFVTGFVILIMRILFDQLYNQHGYTKNECASDPTCDDRYG